MKTLFLALVFVIGGSDKVAETLSVSVDNSTVKWVGSKVGGSHNGTISLSEGNIIMEEGILTGGSFVIDMTSISNDDLKGGSKEKLEGHLKSDDFFGVEKYPTAKFEITSAIPQGSGKYKVIGNITIKGTTKEIKFPATVEKVGEGYTANADITIDRSEFDVRYGSGSFFDGLGDKVIYDDFQLSVSLSTK